MITITDNSGGAALPVGVSQVAGASGTAIAPFATLSTNVLGFGGVPITTTSGPKSFTLTNTGTAPLVITGFSGLAGSDFSQINNCPGSLAVNASCTITVIFAPSATGARAATLTISDNSTGSPSSGTTQNVSLSGTGTDFTISAAPGSVTISL
jgi:hypothetical protein